MDIKITEDMRAEAKKEAGKLGELRNSIMKGEGNEVGILGELAVASLDNFGRLNNYDYDVIAVDYSVWDVKTKQRTVPARPNYNATVANYNTKQECDGYIFVSVYEDTAQIVGWIKKEDFYEKATFYKKGEVDPFSDLGWTFRADCYNLPYSGLRSIDEQITDEVG